MKAWCGILFNMEILLHYQSLWLNIGHQVKLFLLLIPHVSQNKKKEQKVLSLKSSLNSYNFFKLKIN